jgi:hypothetical protein
MTAIEWIVEQYEQKIGKGISSVMADEIKQAKKMDKERIIKTYEVGISRGTNYEEDVYHKNNWRSGEKYYNETFKSE